MRDIARLTRYQIRWILFPARDDDPKSDTYGRPLPKPKPGDKPRFKPKNYRELFFYVWMDIRQVSQEEADKAWSEYVSERAEAGQPVNPKTGTPIYKREIFDPLSRKAAEESDAEMNHGE